MPRLSKSKGPTQHAEAPIVARPAATVVEIKERSLLLGESDIFFSAISIDSDYKPRTQVQSQAI